MKDYKKILEGVMNIINTTEKSDIGFVNICTYIGENCPELKKSEDEQIREEIIDFLMLPHPQFVGKRDHKIWIAWLKKQGEQKIDNDDKTMLNACINTLRNVGHSHLATWLEKQKPMEDFNGEDYGIDSLGHAITILEKTLGEVEGYQTDDGILEHLCAITAVRKLAAKERREQKPVEEVKGISHKWYMCIEGVENFSKGCLYKSNIDDQGTEWITDDTEHSFVYGYYLRYFRPATEEEIPHEPKFKVGDWIVNNKSKDVFFIKSINSGYCSLEDTKGNIYSPCLPFESDFHLWTIADAKDGDVLCTYECDEPKIVFILRGTPKKHYALSYHCYYNIMYPHFGSDSEKGCLAPNDEDVKPATKEQRDALFARIKEAGYMWLSGKRQLVKLLFKEGDTVRKKLDGSIWHINYINEHGYWGNHKPLFPIENQNEFELVKQKPAWREEDENHIQHISDFIMRNRVGDTDAIYRLEQDVKWLKSIKDRYAWKPSDEQIGALEHFVRSITESGFASPYDSNTKLVYSLLNDLKKLKL